MSDIPELIEPVNVTVKQFNQAGTVFSSGVSGRREVINAPQYNADVILPAQIVFGDNEQLGRMSQLGTEEQIKGYMVLRYVDTQAASVQLKRGDKITKIGQLTTEYFFLHTQGDPAAHFSSIGGFTLFRMFFSDRAPSGGNK